MLRAQGARIWFYSRKVNSCWCIISAWIRKNDKSLIFSAKSRVFPPQISSQLNHSLESSFPEWWKPMDKPFKQQAPICTPLLLLHQSAAAKNCIYIKVFQLLEHTSQQVSLKEVFHWRQSFFRAGSRSHQKYMHVHSVKGDFRNQCWYCLQRENEADRMANWFGHE